MTILASTVNCKTMADDSLRLTIDIDPRYADDAFALFGKRGLPCVIARLTQEAATSAQQAETLAANTIDRVADEKPKGGDLARLAGMLCANPKFQTWVCADTESDAREFILATCNIASRAHLDHNPRAASVFHDRIRLPFLAWQKVSA